MEDLKNEVKTGFTELQTKVDKTNEDVGNIKITLKEHEKTFVTYQQLTAFTGWIIGVVIAIAGLVLTFLSLTNKS